MNIRKYSDKPQSECLGNFIFLQNINIIPTDLKQMIIEIPLCQIDTWDSKKESVKFNFNLFDPFWVYTCWAQTSGFRKLEPFKKILCLNNFKKLLRYTVYPNYILEIFLETFKECSKIEQIATEWRT